MITEREALDQIAALCDEWERSGLKRLMQPAFQVQAILDQVASGTMPIPEPGPDIRAERADLEAHWVGTRWRNAISMRVSKVVRVRQNESGTWLAVIAREDGKGAENPVPLTDLPKRYLRERRE